jgi:hypothetical protein
VQLVIFETEISHAGLRKSAIALVPTVSLYLSSGKVT